MMMAIENDAYRPTLGSTPAMIENEIASGMSARATTRPDSRSAFGLDSHASWKRARSAGRAGKSRVSVVNGGLLENRGIDCPLVSSGHELSEDTESSVVNL